LGGNWAEAKPEEVFPGKIFELGGVR
jgi:hypothetical protein